MELGPITGTFGDLIGQRIQECRQSLASRWLHRLTSLLPVDTAAVFPTQELLDHIPELFDEVGVYLRTPETEGIAANSGVISKARELGRLRHQQQASVHQLLHEYEILGDILLTFIVEEIERLGLEAPPTASIEIARRLNQAVCALLRTTVNTFVSEYAVTIQQQNRSP
jgi:hypothetical protein